MADYISTTWFFGQEYTVTYKYWVTVCSCGFVMFGAQWSYTGKDIDITLSIYGESHLC